MPRKKFEALFYIYKITYIVTGKYYIGMHKQTKAVDTYMGSGKRIRRSITKYGIENHIKEILEYLPDMDSLAEREREIVNEEILKDSLCMNLKLGGFGGGGIYNEEHRKNLSEGSSSFMKDRWSDAEYKKHKSELFKKYHKEGVIRGWKEILSDEYRNNFERSNDTIQDLV